MDAAADELYVADGYGNRRVIVFDAGTGAYKRHWGANGRSPGETGVKSFGNPVHCVRIARDGLVYVCDRRHNRIQVLRKDGTFVTEFVAARPARSCRASGGTAVTPASSTGSTTWPSMPRATSTRRRSTTANARRNSCTRASRRWRSRASRPAKISVQNLR